MSIKYSNCTFRNIKESRFLIINRLIPFAQNVLKMYPDEIIKIQTEKMPGSRKLATLHRGYGIHRYFWIGFLYFKIIVTYCQGKFAIDNIHDFSLFSGAAATFFVPVLVIGMSKLFSRLIYNKKVYEMFTVIKNDFWDTSIVREDLDKKLSKRIFIVSQLAANHIYTSLGICFILAIFPLAKYPDGTKQLPSVVWFPFNSNPTPVYEICWFLLALGHHLTVLCNANYDHIYIYFSQHLSVQFCLLKELLRNITDVPSIPDEERYNSKEYQNIIGQRMQTCVKHHIILTNFLTDIQEIFSFCLGVQVMLSILSLVFIGYILETEDNDIAKILKLVIYVAVLSIQATLYAVHGSELEYQFDTVSEAVYDSQWYFGNTGFRKGVQFILMTSQKPIHITALGLADINNTSIIMIYKTVFSILTLLQELVG